jgi:hypothetical protein
MTKSRMRILWAAIAGVCGFAVGGKAARMMGPYLGYDDLVIGIAGGLLGLVFATLVVYGIMND